MLDGATGKQQVREGHETNLRLISRSVFLDYVPTRWCGAGPEMGLGWGQLSRASRRTTGLLAPRVSAGCRWTCVHASRGPARWEGQPRPCRLASILPPWMRSAWCLQRLWAPGVRLSWTSSVGITGSCEELQALRFQTLSGQPRRAKSV